MGTIQKLLAILVVLGVVYGAYTVGMILRGPERVADVTPTGQSLSRVQIQAEQARANTLMAQWAR